MKKQTIKAGRHKTDLQTLKESEARFRSIVLWSPDAIIVTDAKGKIEYMNPAAGKVFNRQVESFIGKDFGLPLVDGESTEIDIFRPGKALGVGDMRVVKTEWLNKKAYLITISDITKRKKIEEELKKIDEMKTEFVSTVSHELRTPLTIIKEGVAQVQEGMLGSLNDDQRRNLTTALNNINRLERIINGILDIAKIDAGKVLLNKEELDLAALAREVTKGFTESAAQKGLQLKNNLPEGRIMLVADRDRLTEVFTNLIGNAIKFTTEGCIEVTVADRGDAVECCVFDTGIGIAKEDLPKMFGKFEQFGRVAGAGEKGTGLGLSIAKGLVELHGGIIWAESELGKGTKITFSLLKEAG